MKRHFVDRCIFNASETLSSRCGKPVGARWDNLATTSPARVTCQSCKQSLRSTGQLPPTKTNRRRRWN